GRELRQRVESRLDPVEVVVLGPVARELLDRRELHALRPIVDELLAWQSRGRDAPAEVVDLLIRYVDAECPNVCCGVDGRAHDFSPLLAQRSQPVAELVDEQLGLLPGGKMPALVELVVVDEVGIGLLRPTPRHLIELVRKDAYGYGDGDALWVEEAELVFPIEASRRDPRVRQPVVGDVVENVVSGKALGLSVEDTYDQRQASRVVVEHPGGEADG